MKSWRKSCCDKSLHGFGRYNMNVCIWQNEPLIMTIDNLMDCNECQNLIYRSEHHGYEQAQVYIGNGQSQTQLSIRNNDRIKFIDKQLAEQLFVLIADYLPKSVLTHGKQWNLCGLNDDFRYYRYQVGQRFKAHLDGSYEIVDYKSFFTVLFYLNDNYQGGETKFFTKIDGRLNLKEPNFIINPKQGSSLIFRHEQFHEGAMVTNGVKYVLRTDAMYQ